MEASSLQNRMMGLLIEILWVFLPPKKLLIRRPNLSSS